MKPRNLLASLLLPAVLGCGSPYDQPAAVDSPPPAGAGVPAASRDAAPAPSQAMRTDLRAMGRAWHDFHDVHNRGPTGWEELVSFAQGRPGADAAAVERAQAAGLKTQWIGSFREATQGSVNTPLAYEPSVEQSSGWVLTLDGAVHWMNSQQFQDLQRGIR